MLLTVHLGGCFRYVPVGSTGAEPGALVVVEINDAGRVALVEALGPGARRIHGQLRESSESAIVLTLNSVEYLDLNVAVRMNGERVEVPRAYIAGYRQRQLSRSRTVLTVALVAAGLLATTLIAISGFGGDDPGDKPGGGGGNGDH